MNSSEPPIVLKPPDLRQETRVQVGDAQDNEYLLNCIIDLGARLTRLEKLFEGEVEAAAKSQDPVDGSALGRERILAHLQKLHEDGLHWAPDLASSADDSQDSDLGVRLERLERLFKGKVAEVIKREDSFRNGPLDKEGRSQVLAAFVEKLREVFR